MKKIIFSDLDGTLINKEQQELHKGNFDAVKRWREKGNLFVICTGRNPIDILPTLKQADLEFDYLVLCNGASLYDKHMNCIYEKEFPLELGKEILLECSKNHEIITFYCDQNELVMQHLDKVVSIDANGVMHHDITDKTFEEYVQNANCFKMLCLIQPEGDHFLYHYQDLLFVPHINEISWFFNKECIDIMAYGVSKGNGMKQLVEMLGIDDNRVYAIGDSFNDLSMIEMACHGTTFVDAPEILRRKAKHIVTSIKELIDNNLD